MSTSPEFDARERILVVDDNAEMRTFVRRLLGDRYQVAVAADGLAGLDEARRQRPDLILTDIIMPRLDGLAFVQAIRSDPALRTLPVIVLSERVEEHARIAGLEAGADDYLVKPFSPRELQARVASQLERQRLRIAVERAAGREEALIEQHRRKDEFLSMLAHELRNPLAPIGYAIELLGVNDLAPEVLDRTRDILSRQMRHLRRIVDDLLDVSRIASGKLSIARERLDLVMLVRHVVRDRSGPLEAQRLRLDVDLPDETVWVLADTTRLGQVLGNLLDNARKFTPAGGTVTLQVRRDPARDAAMIVVRDTGAGIAEPLLRQIFEPFAQAEQTADRSRGGLGLGLAVSRGIIALHEGTITAASDGPGRGAEFTIQLPLQTPPALVGEAPRAEPAIPARLRVLVIEDHDDSAEMLRTLLEFRGCDVRVERTGSSGVDAALAAPPDAVLCDLGLPGMDGYEVARTLRADARTAGVRLIAITGYGRPADRDRARAAGFDLHLVKPVQASELMDQLTGIARSD